MKAFPVSTSSTRELGRLDSEVSAGVFTSSQQVRDFIEKEFGIRYSLSATRGILERLGFVYKKTSEVYPTFKEFKKAVIFVLKGRKPLDESLCLIFH